MILPEVSKDLAKMAPYSPFVIADNYNKSSPSAWWIASEKMGFDKELVLLASSLVGACPSSSGVEQCFSTMGFTYGKLRSQLAVESAEKLAFISDNSILECDFIAKKNFLHNRCFSLNYSKFVIYNSNYKIPTLPPVHRLILT